MVFNSGHVEQVGTPQEIYNVSAIMPGLDLLGLTNYRIAGRSLPSAQLPHWRPCWPSTPD